MVREVQAEIQTLNVQIDLENRLVDSFNDQMEGFQDEQKDNKQKINQLLAQKEENRLRVMKEKKIEMDHDDKGDPYAMNIAYTHFNAMIQKELHNLYNQDETYDGEMFELMQYYQKCQKVIELEKMFQWDVLEFLYRHATPNLGLRFGKPSYVQTPSGSSYQKQPVASIYQLIDSAGANKMKIKSMCLDKLFNKIYNTGAVEVPEKVMKEGAEDWKPPVSEFKTQHEKRQILKQGLAKCKYELIEREFKEEVMKDLQDQRMMSMLGASPQHQQSQTNILIQNNAY